MKGLFLAEFDNLLHEHKRFILLEGTIHPPTFTDPEAVTGHVYGPRGRIKVHLHVHHSLTCSLSGRTLSDGKNQLFSGWESLSSPDDYPAASTPQLVVLVLHRIPYKPTGLH